MEKYLGENDFIISKTDLNGNITYGNEKFIEMSGYKESELLNAPHNILRDAQMPKIVFSYLWENIRQKEEVFAYVKNRCKNGDFYWVFANLTASVNERGDIIGYYSVRRKANPQAIEQIGLLYNKLLELEKTGGVNASKEHLLTLLQQKRVSYNEYIISLQQ